MVEVNKDDYRSREKLKKYLEGEVTKLFKLVLDIAEVAVDGEERYKNLRSKILKFSNNTIRDVKKELDSRYSVTYLPPGEEVIFFNQSKEK